MTDYELEKAALLACGYRVHEKERNGTRWLTACKGLQVRYEHWHPLTNIHQAMQLLLELEQTLWLTTEAHHAAVFESTADDGCLSDVTPSGPTAQDLINAQCRAIVTACASLKAVP